VNAPTLNGPLVDDGRVTTALSQTQRLAGIGTLTASVAHELTNPLSIITSTCNNLLSQIADESLGTDELLHYIELIDHSAWRCARLVQTLRSYSHLDHMQVTKNELNRIIEDSLTIVDYQFERQYNIAIETDLSLELEPLYCDQNQVTQVLINLLINARDALQGEGGVIKIASWNLPEEKSQAFSVSDSGTGISPETIDMVFNPFFTTKPIGEGSGLGLAIASKIVEEHGGRISAENNRGKGVTVSVILPYHPPE
jgi:two-component system NtrC family sensor kinase